MVNGVRGGAVTEAVLAAKLEAYVEQIDVDMVGGGRRVVVVVPGCVLGLPLTAGRAVCATRHDPVAPCASRSTLPPAQALEYQLQQGITDTAKVDACLMPASARHAYGAEAHCAVGVVRLLRCA